MVLWGLCSGAGVAVGAVVGVEVGLAAGAGVGVAAGAGVGAAAGADVCARRAGVTSKNPKAIHLRVRGIRNLPVFASGWWFRSHCTLADSITARTPDGLISCV